MNSELKNKKKNPFLLTNFREMNPFIGNRIFVDKQWLFSPNGSMDVTVLMFSFCGRSAVRWSGRRPHCSCCSGPPWWCGWPASTSPSCTPSSSRSSWPGGTSSPGSVANTDNHGTMQQGIIWFFLFGLFARPARNAVRHTEPRTADHQYSLTERKCQATLLNTDTFGLLPKPSTMIS